MEKTHKQEEINFIIESKYNEGRNEFVFQPIKTQQKQQHSSFSAITRSKALRTRSYSVESSIANSDSTGNSDEELSSGSGSSGSGSPPRQPSPTGSAYSGAGSDGSSGNSEDDFPSLFHPSEAFTYARDSYPIADDLIRKPLGTRWIRDHKNLKKISTQFKVKTPVVDAPSISKSNAEAVAEKATEAQLEVSVPEPTNATPENISGKASLQIVGGGKEPLKGARTLSVPYAFASYPDASNLRRKSLYQDQVVVKEKVEDNFAFKYIPVYQEEEGDGKEEEVLKTIKIQLRDHKNLRVIQSKVTQKSGEKVAFKYIPVYPAEVEKPVKEPAKELKKVIKDHKNLQKIVASKLTMKSPSPQKKVSFKYIPVYQEQKQNKTVATQSEKSTTYTFVSAYGKGLFPLTDGLVRRPLHSGSAK